jgi:hypothetical protein
MLDLLSLTSIKAGNWPISNNHNEAQVRAGGLKVQTGLKAGAWPLTSKHNRGRKGRGAV